MDQATSSASLCHTSNQARLLKLCLIEFHHFEDGDRILHNLQQLHPIAWQTACLVKWLAYTATQQPSKALARRKQVIQPLHAVYSKFPAEGSQQMALSWWLKTHTHTHTALTTETDGDINKQDIQNHPDLNRAYAFLRRPSIGSKEHRKDQHSWNRFHFKRSSMHVF